MQKKILLKKTREYLQSSFPENLLPLRKLRQNEKKSTLQKIRNLKIQVIRAKNEVFKQYANFAKKNFPGGNGNSKGKLRRRKKTRFSLCF